MQIYLESPFFSCFASYSFFVVVVFVNIVLVFVVVVVVAFVNIVLVIVVVVVLKPFPTHPPFSIHHTTHTRRFLHSFLDCLICY